jgi:uncharacterized membrane protein
LAAAARPEDGDEGARDEALSVKRAFAHLFATARTVRRAFPQPVLDRIEAAVNSSEQRHAGEIRFAVEGPLEFLPVLRGLEPRERALELFSLLRVWDTEHNIGVLIYVQLVDRDIEVVADRGIAARIGQAEWDAICRRMEDAFKAGRYEAGALAGIEEVTAILGRHFPPRPRDTDELPDRPVVL